MGLSELLPVQQIATFYAGWYGAELSGVKLADGDPETQLDELCWVNVARRAHPDDDAAAERLLEEGRSLAEHLVCAHSNAIARVAAGLERCGELDEARLEHLLGRC